MSLDGRFGQRVKLRSASRLSASILVGLPLTYNMHHSIAPLRKYMAAQFAGKTQPSLGHATDSFPLSCNEPATNVDA
jgi:hypothetical protein